MFSKKGEFLSTRSLIPIFPLEIKGFTLLEIFHLLFFFSNRWTGRSLSKLEQIFRRASRLTGGGRVHDKI